MKNEQLVKRYEQLAEISGNARHTSNAKEHRETLEDGQFDAAATRSAIKSVCALIAMEV